MKKNIENTLKDKTPNETMYIPYRVYKGIPVGHLGYLIKLIKQGGSPTPVDKVYFKDILGNARDNKSLAGVLDEKADKKALDIKEDIYNKTTDINSSSTDAQYPSAKAVYVIVEQTAEQLEDLIIENTQAINNLAINKQDLLTAGSNIRIEKIGNQTIISASGEISSARWGGIDGVISDQKDLWEILESKQQVLSLGEGLEFDKDTGNLELKAKTYDYKTAKQVGQYYVPDIPALDLIDIYTNGSKRNSKIQITSDDYTTNTENRSLVVNVWRTYTQYQEHPAYQYGVVLFFQGHRVVYTTYAYEGQTTDPEITIS